MQPKRSNKNNVTIQAPKVVVTRNPNPKTQSRPKRGRTRRQKGNDHETTSYALPAAVQTGVSLLPGTCDLPEHATAFVQQYCDPCGEHVNSLDAARVPDGALQSSAGAFFRYTETIAFPFQTSGNVSLAGATYSMLILQLPILRGLSIVLVRENDGEFGQEIMAEFTEDWSIVDPQTAMYPSWRVVGSPATFYYTVLSTEALSNVVPPGANGVSGTIDSYRFSSQGLNLIFNTPDLLNQGTFASMRYPSNISEENYMLPPNDLGTSEFVSIRYNVFTTSPFDRNVFINQRTLVVNGVPVVVVPVFNGLQSSLPSSSFIVPANVRYRTAGGVQIAEAGQTLQYRLQPGSGSILQWFNVTTQTAYTIAVMFGALLGDASSAMYHFYVQNTVENAPQFGEEGAIQSAVNVLVLPPLTQNAIIQANPKSAIQTLKTLEGVYLPGSIMQPVFNVTHSSAYRKTLLLNKTSDINKIGVNILNSDVGWFDTLDQNFAVSVINCQGLPYACKPMIKIVRSVEILPSSDSIVGAFTTGAPEEDRVAIDVCFAFTNNQPHGFPSYYNGLGILFGQITRVLSALPRAYQDARNIVDVVKKTINSSEYEDVRGVLHKGFHALSRIGGRRA